MIDKQSLLLAIKENLNLVDLDSREYVQLDNELTRIGDSATETIEKMTGLALTEIKATRVIVNARTFTQKPNPILIPQNIIRSALSGPVIVDTVKDNVLMENTDVVTLNPMLINEKKQYRIVPNDKWPDVDEIHLIFSRDTNPVPANVFQAILIEAARLWNNTTGDRSAIKVLLREYILAPRTIELAAPILGVIDENG